LAQYVRISIKFSARKTRKIIASGVVPSLQLDYLQGCVLLPASQSELRRTVMRLKLLATTALVVSGVITTAFFVGQLSSSSAQTQTRPRYLPEYTDSGDLILPKNFHEWVFVGSPLTPNALNGGHAGFPEYHNVYIEPGSYEIYKQTNSTMAAT
jgi:hypothetical protein